MKRYVSDGESPQTRLVSHGFIETSKSQFPDWRIVVVVLVLVVVVVVVVVVVIISWKRVEVIFLTGGVLLLFLS